MTVRSRVLCSLAALLGLVVLLVPFRQAGAGRPATGPWLFEVELASSAGTFAQLFWTPAIDFVEEQSTRLPIQAGAPTQTLRFRVPPDVRWLRLDPTDAAAEVRIGRMTLRGADGRVLSSFTTESLTLPHHVASIVRSGDQTLLTTSDNDPWVIIGVGCLASGSASARRSLVTARSLWLAGGLTLALLAACVGVIALDGSRTATAGAMLSSGRWSWVWLPVVFLLVFSAKLLVLGAYPLTVPFWDQWDGEARVLYLPYHTCGLSWAQMFQLHNEHRIFFSRLLALALFLVNGQWDPRLQQVVNAIMHSLTAVLLLAMLWRGLEWRRIDVLALLVIPVFALPHAWENTLMGFQSAFYFFLLFSLLGLWLTTAFRSGSLAWWLGWLCALCGLFTAAGGILLPLVIAGVAVLKHLHGPRQWRALAVTLVVAGAVFALGMATASPPLPHHQPLKAPSTAIFLAAFFRNLAWPWIDHPVAGIVMWLPIAACLIIVAMRWGRTSTFERFVIGLAGWVAGQSAAIAYGRGGGWIAPAPRYLDFLSLGFVANTLVLVLFARQTLSGTVQRRVLVSVLVAWTGVALVGVDSLTRNTLDALDSWRPHWQAQAESVRRFILTGDVQAFKATPAQDVPYPSSDGLIDVLQQPILRRILPASVRQPLPVEPRAVTREAFVPFGAFPTTPRDPLVRGWGSYTASGNAARGDFESRSIAGCEAGARLRVPVAGYLGLAGLSLAMREEATGATTAVTPARVPREEWRTVTVRCPRGPFTLIAQDLQPDYWFAFGEPVEIGWASVQAEAFIEGSTRLMLLAVALTILAAKYTTDPPIT